MVVGLLTAGLLLPAGLTLPALASDEVLVGIGQASSQSGRGQTETTDLGGPDYNGGLTMLGTGSTLTVQGTLDEYEWVKTNMAGRFYPYVIVHAEGNPNVIHFLYEYGHDAESPATFSYTEAETGSGTGGGTAAGPGPGDAAGLEAETPSGNAAGPGPSGTEAASEAAGDRLVPLLMQWDWRWGFNWYGGGPAGLTACAPTCMTMIGLGLTGKETYTVPQMCAYSEGKGYWVNGQGTSWSLVTDAFPDDPIICQTVPVDQGNISYALQQGNPVLINVGVGKFSAVGHFMVLAGVNPDGTYVLNDPNNLDNSSRNWAWSDLAGEIQAAWSYSLRR